MIEWNVRRTFLFFSLHIATASICLCSILANRFDAVTVVDGVCRLVLCCTRGRRLKLGAHLLDQWHLKRSPEPFVLFIPLRVCNAIRAKLKWTFWLVFNHWLDMTLRHSRVSFLTLFTVFCLAVSSRFFHCHLKNMFLWFPISVYCLIYNAYTRGLALRDMCVCGLPSIDFVCCMQNAFAFSIE